MKLPIITFLTILRIVLSLFFKFPASSKRSVDLKYLIVSQTVFIATNQPKNHALPRYVVSVQFFEGSQTRIMLVRSQNFQNVSIFLLYKYLLGITPQNIPEFSTLKNDLLNLCENLPTQCLSASAGVR